MTDQHESQGLDADQEPAAEAEFRYQAQDPRVEPLTFSSRPATAYAWAQARRLHGRNPLTLLVYLAAAEDADRGTWSGSGYSCALSSGLAAMLGLREETVQPSVDYLVAVGLLLAVPATRGDATPAIAYRVNEAHFNSTQR
jgi:hypothetical protein